MAIVSRSFNKNVISVISIKWPRHCEGVIAEFSLFYGFNGAHGFDEHAAGEVRCERHHIVIGGGLMPAAGVEIGARVDAFVGHHSGKTGDIVAKTGASGDVEVLLVD